MSQAADYPITFPYGATSPPYGTPEYPHHKGCDRAMPVGTPVIVNGVQIGLSGNTGTMTSGPHCHTGRFINGQDTNPGNGGFVFNSAVVTQIGEDADDGKFVRIQADGASWVYLHLSEQTCTVGQTLVAPIINKEYVMDDDAAKDLWRLGLHREPENDQVWRPWSGKTFNDGSDYFRGQPEWLTQNDILLRAYPALTANVTNLQSQIAALQSQLATALAAPTTETVSTAVATAQDCQVQVSQATTTIATVPTPKPIIVATPVTKTSLLMRILSLFATKS